MKWAQGSRQIILAMGTVYVTSFAAAASGTEGAAFLRVPIGGAPAAMGSAYTALATDAYAPVINPAGLGFVDTPQLAGTHVSYLETSHYDFASYVHPFSGNRSLGASLQYYGSGDITERGPTGIETGDFSAHYEAFTLAYGQTLTDKLSLGLSGKWVHGSIADVSADAFAADAGALYKFTPHVNGSLVVQNAGSQLTFLNQSDPLPLNIRTGLAWVLPHQWTVSAEGSYHEGGQLTGHFGSQWQLHPTLALRAGYRTDNLDELSAIAGFSTGVGLTMWGSEFSYTWLPYGDLGQTHSFALVLRFGKPKNSLRAAQAGNLNFSEPSSKLPTSEREATPL